MNEYNGLYEYVRFGLCNYNEFVFTLEYKSFGNVSGCAAPTHMQKQNRGYVANVQCYIDFQGCTCYYLHYFHISQRQKCNFTRRILLT